MYDFYLGPNEQPSAEEVCGALPNDINLGEVSGYIAGVALNAGYTVANSAWEHIKEEAKTEEYANQEQGWGSPKNLLI
ncbi:MAG: hypothetical protein DGJ47_000264 [Rickettsiaceae bacterium]